MLVQVAVESRSSVQLSSEQLAMQTELVDWVCRRVFNNVEVRVVAITRYDITVLPIPLRELHTEVFCQFCCFYDQPRV